MGFRLQRSPNPVVAALINSFQRMENISLIINIVCPILGIFMLVNLLASGSKPSAAAACIAHVGSVQQSRGPDWALSAAWCSDCHPLHRNGFYHRTSRRQKQQTSGVILPRSAVFLVSFFNFTYPMWGWYRPRWDSRTGLPWRCAHWVWRRTYAKSTARSRLSSPEP